MMLLALAATAILATAPPAEGIDGLCDQIARLTVPVVGSSPAAFQLVAEGAALDIADEVNAQCRSKVLGPRPQASLEKAERVVRVRVRVTGSSLVGLVEVTTAGQGSALLTEAVETPMGSALARWLGSGGSGVETWLAGSIDDRILALCGSNPDGGPPEVAFVTGSAIQVMRWTPDGFDFIAHVDLPTELRARARSPGATAICRASGGALIVAFGIHDRGQGGILRVAQGKAQPISPLKGVPIGWDPSGQPILAEGVPGTRLLRWKGATLAAMTSVTDGKRTLVLGVSATGAVWANGALGRPFKVGDAVAIADVDGRGTLEAVFTKPVFPGEAGDDRFVVTSLNGATVRRQSASVPGVLKVVGVVGTGRWQRVLGVRWVDGRSQIYALGKRLPIAAAH